MEVPKIKLWRSVPAGTQFSDLEKKLVTVEESEQIKMLGEAIYNAFESELRKSHYEKLAFIVLGAQAEDGSHHVYLSENVHNSWFLTRGGQLDQINVQHPRAIPYIIFIGENNPYIDHIF